MKDNVADIGKPDIPAHNEKPSEVADSPETGDLAGKSGESVNVPDVTAAPAAPGIIDQINIGSDSYFSGVTFGQRFETNISWQSNQPTKDPTHEIRIAHMTAVEDAFAVEHIQEIKTRLISSRVLFVLFEAEEANRFELLKCQLMRAIGEAEYVFRSSSNSNLLDFKLLFERPEFFKYDKSAVMLLPGKTIQEDPGLLTDIGEISRLAEQLAALDIYLLLGISRQHVQIDYADFLHRSGHQVWTIERQENSPSLSSDMELKFTRYDLLERTALFVTVFFPGLARHDFSNLVRKMVIHQQARITPMRTGPANSAESPAMPGDDFVWRWENFQDNILEKCDIVFQQRTDGPGGYAWVAATSDLEMKSLLLKHSASWCGRQFESILLLLLANDHISEAFENGVGELLLALHEKQIITVSPTWLWGVFTTNVTPDDSGVILGAFRRLLHSLLKSRICGEQARAFLQLMSQRCREYQSAWLETFLEIEAVSACLVGEDLPSSAHEIVGSHIRAVCASLTEDQLAPLSRLIQIQLIMIGSMGFTAPRQILGLLFEIANIEPRHAGKLKRLVALKCDDLARPGIWYAFWYTHLYLQELPEMLGPFGAALLEMYNELNIRDAGPAADSLSMLFDAFHQSAFDITQECDGSQEKAQLASRHLFDDADKSGLLDTLASSNTLRSPPRSWTFAPDDPLFQCTDIGTTVFLYEGLTSVALSAEMEKTPLFRERVESLMQSLARALNARQRQQAREILRRRKEYSRYMESKQDRKTPGALKQRQRTVVLAAMLSAFAK